MTHSTITRRNAQVTDESIKRKELNEKAAVFYTINKEKNEESTTSNTAERIRKSIH